MLTRDGEVEIAKRIERGQLTVLKSLSRSPVIVREIISLGEQLKKDPSIIKDILQFSDEELTDEKIEEKHQETLDIIDQIGKTYKKVQQLRAKARHDAPKSKKAAIPPRTLESGPHARATFETGPLARILQFAKSCG